MSMSVVSKLITAAFAAALVAGVVVAVTAAVPQAKAAPVADSAPHQLLAKGDRLSISVPSAPVLPASVKGSACSLNAWPNYEPSCQSDPNRPANDTRTIRIIALR